MNTVFIQRVAHWAWAIYDIGIYWWARNMNSSPLSESRIILNIRTVHHRSKHFFFQKSSISPIFVCQELDYGEGGIYQGTSVYLNEYSMAWIIHDILLASCHLGHDLYDGGDDHSLNRGLASTVMVYIWLLWLEFFMSCHANKVLWPSRSRS